MFQPFLQFSQTPFAALIGLGLGFIGVVLAVYFYVKSRRWKELQSFQSSRTIFSRVNTALDGLEISYRGKPQDMVTITRLTLWNSGSETIDSSDMSTAHPLQIRIAPDVSILECSVTVPAENPFNLTTPSVMGDHQYIGIQFEYLDSNEGGVLEIVHNGSEETALTIQGKIKGGRGPTTVSPLLARRPRLFGPLTPIVNSAYFAWLGVISYAVGGIWLISEALAENFRIPYLLGGALCLCGAYVMYWGYVRDQVPSKFLKYV